MDNEKKCSKCLNFKSFHEFKKNRGKLRSDCKSCNKEYRKQYEYTIKEQKAAYYERMKPETQKQKIQRLEAEVTRLLTLIDELISKGL